MRAEACYIRVLVTAGILSVETAFVTISIDEEYRILALYGLQATGKPSLTVAIDSK